MTDRMGIRKVWYLSSGHSDEPNIQSVVLEEAMALGNQQHNRAESHCAQMQHVHGCRPRPSGLRSCKTQHSRESGGTRRQVQKLTAQKLHGVRPLASGLARRSVRLSGLVGEPRTPK
jgi:hypothetical protein